MRLQIKGRQIFSESVTGSLLGIQSTINTAAIALIIFNGPLIPYFPLGLKVALISAIVYRIVISLYSSSPLEMAGVQEIYAIIGSLIIAGIYKHFLNYFPDINPLPTIFIALACLTVLFGIWLYILGRFNLGNFVQFIPYPVLSGFLAATGWLMIASGFTMITSQAVSFHHFIELFPGYIFWIAIMSALYAIFMYMINRKYSHPQYLFILIVAALVLFYAIVFIYQFSFDQLQQMQLMFAGTETNSTLSTPQWNNFYPHWNDFKNIQWKLLLANLDQDVIFIMIASLTLLLNMSGFELISHTELNVNKDLKLLGKTNILLGLFGGYAGYLSLSTSVINASLGSKTRLPALLSAFVCLLALIFSSTILHYVPRFIFGIITMYIGLSLFMEWLIFTYKRFAWPDYTVLLLIFFSIIIFNLLTGFVIGLMAAVVLFTFKYSQIKIIKAIYSGSNMLHSNVERGPNDNSILEQHAHELYVVVLQGYLYFGNMYNLYVQIKKAIKKEKIKFIVIDCAGVIGIDSSSILGFIKIIQLANTNQIEIIFTHRTVLFTQQLEEGIQNHNLSLSYRNFESLDSGLEWVENKLIKSEEISEDMDVHTTTGDTLASLMQQIQEAGSFLSRETFKPGEIIFHEHDASDIFYYIESGSVDIVLETSKEKRRVRRTLSGIIIGEMGMYLNVPRTATVRASQHCVLLGMSRKGLKSLEAKRPDLANELHKQIIKGLSKNVIYSNYLLTAQNI